MATDIGQLLERTLGDLQPPDGLQGRAMAGRSRHRVRRRLAAGTVGILAAVAAVALIWATVGGANRAGTATLIPASPARGTGRADPVG